MATAAVALGSNLGDRLGQLRSAVRAMDTIGRVVAVSPLYETDPVGGPAQGRYLNAVVVVDTDLDPMDLLSALHRIEGDSERVREVRWGPRTLDLDVVTYDDVTIDTPELQIPHPRAHERHFVLAPLNDVLPGAVLADGSQAVEAIERVRDQAVSQWEGDWLDEAPRLGREANWWVAGQVVAFTVWLLAIVLSGPGTVELPWLLAGGIVTAMGLAQGFAAVRAFGTKITPSPQPRSGSGLVASGIYGRVRHPMYGAILLAFGGVALVAGSVPGLAVTAIVGLFLRAKSVREERILSIVVSGYDDYRQRVPKRFVPFVW